jgi:hypothetical protein
MASSVSTCATCGASGSGNFCSACGTPRGGAPCSRCGGALAANARFCAACGRAVGGSRAKVSGEADRTPWIVAGISVAGLLGMLLFTLVRQAPARTEPSPIQPTGEASAAGESPPDLSTMSPRERFNRLYNRIMRGAEAGDEATVTRFTPMALMAYAQLDTIDADARFHAALLRVHTGDAAAARALGDTLLRQTPGHLFGYVILGTVARWQKDDAALRQAYAGFLQHYDAEMKAGRKEYDEHSTSLSDFRQAALSAKGGGKSSAGS